MQQQPSAERVNRQKRERFGVTAMSAEGQRDME